MKNFWKKDNLSTLCILLFGIFVGFLSALKGSEFLGILFSISLFLGVFTLFSGYKDKVFSKIILLGIILRSGLAYFQRFVAPLPDSTGDAVSFERRAWGATEAWIEGLEGMVLTGAHQYSRVISWFYYFFEREPLIPQFLNVFLGTLVIFIVYKTAFVLFKEKKVAHIAALITALFPTLNLYSAIIIRETIIVFFFSLSFFFFSRWIKKGRFKDILFSLIAIFISSIFHGAIVLIGFVYLFVYLFYKPGTRKWKIINRQLIIGGFLVLILFTGFYGYFRSKIPEPRDVTAERLERTAETRARGDAIYLEDISTESYLDAVWQTPVRVVYFYFAPFVWQVRTVEDVMGVMDISLYLILLVFFLKSMKRIKREDKALYVALWLILIIFSVVFAWGTSNYGTSIRHRQKIVVLLITVASYGIVLKNKAPNNKHQITNNIKI